MQNGPENLGNGSADDPLNGPLTGPLGPATLANPLPAGPLSTGPLSHGPLSSLPPGPLSALTSSERSRTPGSLRGPESLRSAESFRSAEGYGEPDGDPGRRNGSMGALPPLPALTSLPELADLSEPVFEPSSWLELPGEPLADHPLLRGLLLELPPKGSAMPSSEWLNRWFEAVRSVLELLYAGTSTR
jgi:hypothetical protein